MIETEWDSSWPDWIDADRPVEIQTDAGEIIEGILTIEDFFPDGEGGETPVFGIKTKEGTVSFADHKNWRFK